jgi:hypothetical protein
MNAIQNLLRRIDVVDPESTGSLFVWPLVERSPVQTTPVLTLDEAIEGALVDVTEISASGSVAELQLNNRSGLTLFLLDGEQILGAKQNRTFNLSMLVHAGESTRVPVTCLEQGRWRMSDQSVRSAEHVHFASGRAGKMQSVSSSLKHYHSFQSDQGAVWDDISARMDVAEMKSQTMAEADYYASRRQRLEVDLEAVPCLPDQVGAVFGIGSRIVGLEVFSEPSLYQRLSRKVARSFLLDALEIDLTADPGSKAAVAALIEKVFNSNHVAYPAPGGGESVRFNEKDMHGAALVEDNQCLHLAVLTRATPR